MTEAEWLTSDETMAMWSRLRHPRSRRVASLFAAACVRATPAAERQPLLLSAAEVVERVADTGDWGGLDILRARAGEQCHEPELETVAHYWALAALRLIDSSIDFYAVHVPFFMLKALAEAPNVSELARRYADILRDIAGLPSRHGRGKRMKKPTKARTFPVLHDSHVTSTVRDLAVMMYEARDFGAMPILADSLQDAGCDNNDILTHCRDANATHVRGCWVVDLVLGKS